MLSVRPKQRPGEKEASFVRVRFWEIDCKVFFQKNLLYLQFQNRCQHKKNKSLPVLRQFCVESNW